MVQQVHIPSKLYNSRPNAIKAAKLSIEAKRRKCQVAFYNVPTKFGDSDTPGEMYGGSYNEMDPMTHTNQLFGRYFAQLTELYSSYYEKKDKVGGPI